MKLGTQLIFAANQLKIFQLFTQFKIKEPVTNMKGNKNIYACYLFTVLKHLVTQY